MSILALPMSLDDLELAWLKESYAEGYGKTGKVIAQRNYVLNPNAEVDTTNVSALGSVVTRDTVEKFSGAASYKCVTDGVTGQAGILFLLSNNRPSGKKWRGSMRVKFPAGATYQVIYRHWDGTTSRDYASALITGDGTWQFVPTVASITENAPANSSNGWFGVRISGSAVRTFWVDEAVLSTGSDIPEYIDGSLADNAVFTYDWEGTPNNSSSIKWSKEPILATQLIEDPFIQGTSDWLPAAGMAVTLLSPGRLLCSASSFTASGRIRAWGPTASPLGYWAVKPGDVVKSTWEIEAVQDLKIAPFFNRVDAGGSNVGTDIGPTSNLIKAGQTATVTYEVVVPTDTSVAIQPNLRPRDTTGGLALPDGDYFILTKSTLYINESAKGPERINRSTPLIWSGTEQGSSQGIIDINARDLAYLEKNYWSKLSGLSEPASLADHKLAALRANVKTVAGDPLTVSRKNLAKEPGFEGNDNMLNRFKGARGTISRDGAVFKSGTKSCKFVADGTAGASYLIINDVVSAEGAFACKPNTAYSAKISGYRQPGSPNLNQINIRAYLYDSNNGLIAQVEGDMPALVDSVWVTGKNINFVTPANCTKFFFYVILGTNASVGETVYLDEILVEETSQDLPYFDGESGSLYRWTDVQHLSTSELVDPSKHGITDLWVSYLMSRSGLNPASKWSLGDHELAFYKSQLGL